jgi:hypothetical protein
VAAFDLLAGLWRNKLLARESLVAKYERPGGVPPIQGTASGLRRR